MSMEKIPQRLRRGIAKTAGAIAIAAAGMLYSGEAAAEDAGQPCDRYAAKVQFKRHGPSPGFMKRTATYITSDLEARRPDRNLEGRLSKFHPVVFRHAQLPGLVDTMIGKLDEFDTPLVEIYAFASKRKVRHPEKISQLLAQTRVQFLDLAIGMGLKARNIRAEREGAQTIDAPLTRLYKVGSTTRFGKEGANDIGIIILRQYTGLEPVDFNSDTKLSQTMQHAQPMTLLCVDPVKTEPIPPSVESESTSRTPAEEPAETEDPAELPAKEPVHDGGFQSDNPYGHKTSLMTGKTLKNAGSVREYSGRLTKLEVARTALRDRAYKIFVIPYDGLRPECYDRLDNDGDGLADYTGVSRAKGGPFDPDPDCTSARDLTEGPRACEGVVEALFYIADSLDEVSDRTVQAEVCRAYFYLADKQTKSNCLAEYEDLVTKLTEFAREGVKLKAEIESYCSSDRCGQDEAAELIKSMEEFENLSKELILRTKIVETYSIKSGPDLQALCQGLSV